MKMTGSHLHKILVKQDRHTLITLVGCNVMMMHSFQQQQEELRKTDPTLMNTESVLAHGGWGGGRSCSNILINTTGCHSAGSQAADG